MPEPYSLRDALGSSTLIISLFLSFFSIGISIRQATRTGPSSERLTQILNIKPISTHSGGYDRVACVDFPASLFDTFFFFDFFFDFYRQS